MIEDKSLGLVVAENEDEKFYIELIENSKDRIKRLKQDLKLGVDILEMAERKLEELQRVKQETIEDGA